jgi:SNF2 family DNA or RNA helicase
MFPVPPISPHKSFSIEKFLVAAGNAEQFDGNANVEQALQKLGLPVLFQPLPGMTVALMPHQAIGVAWMLEKERSSAKGGCMADEMGLGKVSSRRTMSYVSFRC